MIDHQTPAAERLLRLPDVLATVGMSRSQLYALAARGEFPRAVRLSERSVAWVEGEVRAWVAARIAARDGREAARR